MLWKGPAGWELGLGALAVSKALVPWVGARPWAGAVPEPPRCTLGAGFGTSKTTGLALRNLPGTHAQFTNCTLWWPPD